MNDRIYKLRGVPDCPVSVYPNSKRPRAPHRHPEVELITPYAGPLYCRLEDTDITLNAGDILIVNPNALHAVLDRSEGLFYHNVIFSTEIITMPPNHVFQKRFVTPLKDGILRFPTLIRPEHPAYETVYNALFQLTEGNPYSDNTKIFRFARIIELCTALQPYCHLTQDSGHQSPPEDHTVRKIITHIHFYYRQPLSLEYLADYVHLHPNYLCHIFKAYTGQTVMEHLAQTRVEAAKFLLRRDALPMPRVAELTGFSSERAFYRQFRKITGMTPKAYQKQQLQLDSRF